MSAHIFAKPGKHAGGVDGDGGMLRVNFSVEKMRWWWCCMVVWVEVVSVEDEAQQQNVKGRNTPHERQAAAKFFLAVRCGSREAREGVVVARRRVRMGMGGFAWSYHVDTAYTDPFPTSSRKSVVLVRRYGLRRGVAANTLTPARLA